MVTRKKRRMLILCCLPVLWMIGVHRCIVVDGCSICASESFYEEYRIFGITLQKSLYLERRSLIERIAVDLGTPCEHRGRYTGVGRRYWGGFLQLRADSFGLRMIGESKYTYTERFRDEVRMLGKKNPQLGDEFRLEVLYKKNLDYLEEFFKRIEPNLGPEEFTRDSKSGISKPGR